MNPPTQKNAAAVALGRMAAGKPKNYSPAERDKRAQRMRLMRAKMVLDSKHKQAHASESSNETTPTKNPIKPQLKS